MRAAVFRALCGQRDHTEVKIEFAPAERTDLFTPSAGQNKQPHDISIDIVPEGCPDITELIAREQTLTRSLFAPFRPCCGIAFQ
jgi:hypothetical protein